MESDRFDPQSVLAATDRAEASAWIDYPPTPAWYPLGVGLWMALLVASNAIGSVPLRAVAMLALVGVEVGWISWYRHHKGAMPSGLPPRELARPIGWFLGALVATAVVVVTLAVLVSVWAGAVAALVLVTGTVWLYERLYAEAAARARQRLA